MTRAALYARVSTDEQATRFGLAAQVHELRVAAAARGYTVAAGAEFVDDGHSGATLERPALTRLRDTVRARAVDVVLVHDPDRLSRRLPHQLLLLEELEARARVEFVTTPRETTPEGQLLLNVKGVVAEYERLKIQERTLRGKREKARRGQVVASYPYGYRPDAARRGYVVVHDPEAAVVRMIYGWLIDEGRSVRSIVDELRALGVPPATAARAWGPTQVRRIVASDRYTGRTWYKGIEIPIPAIITPERHAAARAQLARNAVALVGRPAVQPYLLRGLLRCASCPYPYVSYPSKGRRYYRCRGYDRFSLGPRCLSPVIQAPWSEGAVWEAVTGLLRQPAVLREAAERYAATSAVRDLELSTRLEVLRRALATLDGKERRALEVYLEEGIDKPALLAQVRGIVREREGVRAELARAEAQVVAQGAVGGHEAAIARWCATAARGMDRLDVGGRQKLLGLVVDQVRVALDRSLEIHGRVPFADVTELALASATPVRNPGVGYVLVIPAEGRR